MNRNTLLLLLVTSLPVAIDARPKRATPSSDEAEAEPAKDPRAKDEARSLLQQGIRHFKRRRWSKALEKFQEAYETYPSPKILANIGATYRALDRPIDALAAYERFLHEVGPEVPETREEVETEVAALSAVIGELRIEAPDGTHAVVEERSLGDTPIEPVRLVAGRYQVKLVVPGRGEFTLIEEVVGGQASTVRPPPETVSDGGARTPPDRVTIPASPSGQAETRPEVRMPAAPSGPPPSRAREWAAWTTTAAGAAMAGVGVLFAVQARSAASDANGCIERSCPLSEFQEAKDRHESRKLLSGVLLGVGAAAAVGGGTWAYWIRRGRGAQTAGPQIELGDRSALVSYGLAY